MNRLGNEVGRRRLPCVPAMAIALLVAASSVVQAEEPKGCDAFKWPLKQEAALLQAANKPAAPTDGSAKDECDGLQSRARDVAGRPSAATAGT